MYKNTVYCIDVSQSVEHEHPHALEFLRKDCTNAIEFFKNKLRSQILTVTELFDFVVLDLQSLQNSLNSNVADIMVLIKLRHLSISDRSVAYLNSEEAKSKDSYLQQVYIPRVLEDVKDIEKDAKEVEVSVCDI